MIQGEYGDSGKSGDYDNDDVDDDDDENDVDDMLGLEMRLGMMQSMRTMSEDEDVENARLTITLKLPDHC